MNWDAVGAIANLLAAAGVVTSLIYLGVQIRQGTRTARARAFQDIFNGFTAQNLQMFSPENIDLIISGMRDFNGLAGRDKLRFDHLMMGYFNVLEATIFSKSAFLLGEETLENWSYALRGKHEPMFELKTVGLFTERPRLDCRLSCASAAGRTRWYRTWRAFGCDSLRWRAAASWRWVGAPSLRRRQLGPMVGLIF